MVAHFIFCLDLNSGVYFMAISLFSTLAGFGQWKFFNRQGMAQLGHILESHNITFATLW
jgi:hypothetical protein